VVELRTSSDGAGPAIPRLRLVRANCYHCNCFSKRNRATVIHDLLPLLIIFAVAGAIYKLRQARKTRFRINPPQPAITMTEAWNKYKHNLQNGSIPVPRPFSISQATLAEEIEAELVASLVNIEQKHLADSNPRLAVRRAILENATVALHLEAISRLPEPTRRILLKGYREGMDKAFKGAIMICKLRCAVLRLYSQLKYDDAVNRDWFYHFVWVAAPYIKEKIHMTRRHVIEMDADAKRFVEIYDELLSDLRQEALAARPKQRFLEPDLP